MKKILKVINPVIKRIILFVGILFIVSLTFYLLNGSDSRIDEEHGRANEESSIKITSLSKANKFSKNKMAPKPGLTLNQLGEMIFTTPLSTDETVVVPNGILNKVNSVSCSTCHQSSFAFGDNKIHSIGFNGQVITRKAPPLLNTANYESFFWDGRINKLNVAVLQAFTNQFEMGNKNLDEVLNKIRNNKNLSSGFKQLNLEVNQENLGLILEQYVFNLKIAHDHLLDSSLYNATNSGLDKLNENLGENLSLEDKKNGMKFENGLRVFNKLNCQSCHNPLSGFTDNLYHPSPIKSEDLQTALNLLKSNPDKLSLNELVSVNPKVSDLGRYLYTKNLQDLGCFRTPSLLNEGVQVSFYHDGRFSNLKDVVDWEIYYRNPDGISFINLDDKENLLYFLQKI